MTITFFLFRKDPENPDCEQDRRDRKIMRQTDFHGRLAVLPFNYPKPGIRTEERDAEFPDLFLSDAKSSRSQIPLPVSTLRTSISSLRGDAPNLSPAMSLTFHIRLVAKRQDDCPDHGHKQHQARHLEEIDVLGVENRARSLRCCLSAFKILASVPQPWPSTGLVR